MRLVLAILAIVALLAGPVTAAAAQSRCNEAPGSTVMDGMDMPGIAHASGPKSAADPCRDHSVHHKTSNRSCAQVCGANCTVAIALPSALASVIFVGLLVADVPATPVSAHPFEPSLLRRPPKSIV